VEWAEWTIDRAISARARALAIVIGITGQGRVDFSAMTPQPSNVTRGASVCPFPVPYGPWRST